MSSDLLLMSVARMPKTDESGSEALQFELQVSPLESGIHQRLPEPSDEELDAVLSGEKSHDGGDHADADTRHRIEQIEPYFRLCAWFGLHAAATAPLTFWQKTHGIVILVSIAAGGIRSALFARQLREIGFFNAALHIFLAVFFLASTPAFSLKLRLFWSRSQLHRSFSLLLDPAHDMLMHSTRIQFTNRARSISAHKLFVVFLGAQIGLAIVSFHFYIVAWSLLVELNGPVGIYAALIFDCMITPYLIQCALCDYFFVQFVCDSHECAIRRLEALFVSSRLAQSLEKEISCLKPDWTMELVGMFLDSSQIQ
jgi:hypothetical protein